MEFVRTSDDCFAGYLQEDSDLEFSGCSDEARYIYTSVKHGTGSRRWQHSK